MYLPIEIVGTVLGVLLVEIFATVGFFWKYNEDYHKDKEALSEFLSNMTKTFTKELADIKEQRLSDLNDTQEREFTCESGIHGKIKDIESEFERNRLMSERDIKDLNVKMDTITKKVDETQLSISTIHERIDDLFKMIQSKTTTRKPTKTALKSAKKDIS